MKPDRRRTQRMRAALATIGTDGKRVDAYPAAVCFLRVLCRSRPRLPTSEHRGSIVGGKGIYDLSSTTRPSEGAD